METSEKIVNIANAYADANITEIQVNAGWQPNSAFPNYDADMTAIGWYKGAEWCAAAAILDWKQGLSADIWAIAKKLVSLNSQQMADNFHADPIWPTSSNIPKLGAIVVWQSGDSETKGHTGVVVAIDDDGVHFTSVEGNSSSTTAPDTRTGWTVARHVHALGLPHSNRALNLDRFIYPIESYNPLVISE